MEDKTNITHYQAVRRYSGKNENLKKRKQEDVLRRYLFEEVSLKTKTLESSSHMKPSFQIWYGLLFEGLKRTSMCTNEHTDGNISMSDP